MSLARSRAFDAVFILTNGGPIDSTQMPALYMYQKTFNQFQFGPGSAIAVLIFLLAIVALFVINGAFWVSGYLWKGVSRRRSLGGEHSLQKPLSDLLNDLPEEYSKNAIQ